MDKLMGVIGLLTFIIGLITLIKPINILKITNRKTAGIIAASGFVAFIVGAANGDSSKQNAIATAKIDNVTFSSKGENVNSRIKIAREWLDCGSKYNNDVNSYCRSLQIDEYDVAGFPECKSQRLAELCGVKPTEQEIDQAVAADDKPNPYGVWMANFAIGQERCKRSGLVIMSKEYIACAEAFAGPRPHER